MKVDKQPWHIRMLIPLGLLMTTLPMLLKEYIAIPDFFRGLLAGVGLGLEIIGFILQKKSGRSACNRTTTETQE